MLKIIKYEIPRKSNNAFNFKLIINNLKLKLVRYDNKKIQKRVIREIKTIIFYDTCRGLIK